MVPTLTKSVVSIILYVMNTNMIDMLQKRRSIRSFTQEKIDEQTVEYLINAALLSPSSMNRRPWEVVVVDDSTLIEKLSQAKEHGSAFAAAAPLLLVIAADTKKSDVWIEDCSIVSILVQLAAHSAGLGSCWIQIRNRHTANGESSSGYIKRLCSLPDTYAVESIIALGYPAEDKSQYNLDELPREKIHKNSF